MAVIPVFFPRHPKDHHRLLRCVAHRQPRLLALEQGSSAQAVVIERIKGLFQKHGKLFLGTNLKTIGENKCVYLRMLVEWLAIFMLLVDLEIYPKDSVLQTWQEPVRIGNPGTLFFLNIA